jgi:cytochrome c oxidase cbb3-type subunit 1
MSLSWSEALIMGTPADMRTGRVKSAAVVPRPSQPSVMALAAWHSLFWLVFANAVGVLLATLLLFPKLNNILGEWTYGRWMPVHINLQLYGWCSLPLVAFLLKVYGADREPASRWCRSVLWIWSSALGVGTLSWLNGHSSGKLFLDWTGYSRVLFPLALAILWFLLAFSFAKGRNNGVPASFKANAAKLTGLVLLLAVPVLIYVAASPDLYPPINPDSGGPTGASQLESTLVIVAVLLLLPFGLTHLKAPRPWPIVIAWIILGIEVLLCVGLGRTDVSNHRPIQYISLGSLLVWIPLTPAYYGAFEWHSNTRRWRTAFICWWAVLVPTGWFLFLPGVLEQFKFTDGLVGHSLLAMAGFVSSLLIFVMVQLLAEDGWILNSTWSFWVWHGSVLAYVLLMFLAGWREGLDPAFTVIPGRARTAIYALRLLLGALMLIASGDWLLQATKLLRQPNQVSV